MIILSSIIIKGQEHTCNVSLWLNKLLKIRLHERYPLFDATFDVSTPFLDVANYLLCLSISPDIEDGNGSMANDS